MSKSKKVVESDTEEELVLQNLLDLIEELSIHIKYDRGVFNGGFARYKDDKYFYLNRKSKIQTRIALIVDELKEMEIPEKLISPEIKEILTSTK